MSDSTDFVHQRHKEPQYGGAKELILAIPPLRSSVNLSRIARVAGCCGVARLVVAGNAKLDPKIARDAVDNLEIQNPRTLQPALAKLKQAGLPLIGLEQTTNSVMLHEVKFPEKMVLVLGHERHGLTPDLLAMMDEVVEIPVFGMPFSYNVATATSLALYEYCRQRLVGR